MLALRSTLPALPAVERSRSAVIGSPFPLGLAEGPIGGRFWNPSTPNRRTSCACCSPPSSRSAARPPLAAQPTPAATVEEAKAIALIVKAGGEAAIDPTLAEGARVAAKFEAANDALLIGLKKLPQVGAVNVFDATACTEKGLLALKELPHLRRLVLSKSGMTAGARRRRRAVRGAARAAHPQRRAGATPTSPG